MQGGGGATRGDAKTSQQADTNEKRGAIGRGCGGDRVERTRGGGVDMTTSLQTRDNHGGSNGEGDGDGTKKCCAGAITVLGDDRPHPRG
jgi:hypothetical protein